MRQALARPGGAVLLRPTTASIDLEALAANYALAERLAGGRAVVAVVKADAYGHGAPAVAERLVASPDRGLALASAQLLARSGQVEDRAQQGMAMLGSSDWMTREAGACLLGALACEGALREEVVEALEAVARDDADEDVRRMAEAGAGGLRG